VIDAGLSKRPVTGADDEAQPDMIAETNTTMKLDLHLREERLEFDMASLAAQGQRCAETADYSNRWRVRTFARRDRLIIQR
jgi:hypothetical protein